MGWLRARAERTQAKLEARVAPAIAMIAEPGDIPKAQGYGVVMPTNALFLLGAGAILMARYYWVVVTDRRVALVRVPVSGDVRIEQVVPRSTIALVSDRKGVGTRRLTIAIDGKRTRFNFPTRVRDDGAAIAAALRSPPQEAPPARPD
jgi:hypothetical protein